MDPVSLHRSNLHDRAHWTSESLQRTVVSLSSWVVIPADHFPSRAHVICPSLFAILMHKTICSGEVFSLCRESATSFRSEVVTTCTGYRFACSPFMAGFMELKHSERRQLKTAGSVVAEKVVKLTQNAIFGRCCMNPDKFRNYVDPAKFERAVGKSSVTNFQPQINDSEGFLAFVETLKTDRSKACMSVPTQVGARTLQLSKLMMEKAYYLHMRRLFPKMRLLFTFSPTSALRVGTSTPSTVAYSPHPSSTDHGLAESKTDHFFLSHVGSTLPHGLRRPHI